MADAADTDGKRLDEVHRRALRRFDAAALPQQETRAHALLCRRFISIPGAMWEGPWGEQFEHSIKVEVDKVSKGLEKIQNDYRANRIVPDFRPAGGRGDQETADTLDGIHRADSYHFKAQQARDNAFDEAAAGGFGAYRLANELADPFDQDSDAQRINPGLLIADADQRVFFDPNAKKYDKSDARYAFVLTAIARDTFEEDHEGRAADWPEERLSTAVEWFAPDQVIVAEYYEVTEKTEDLLIFRNRLTDEEQRWWRSEIEPADIEELKLLGNALTVKRRKRRRVLKFTMTGAEVLEEHGPIAGDLIPIVPVYGKRWFVDGIERFRGHVSKLMDAQRIYNAKVSKLSETDALSPREKPIFDPEQMPPHLQTLWQNQERERHPYALANALRDENGQILHMGPIGKIEAPQVAPVTAALLQIAAQDLAVESDDGADEVVANTSAQAMDIAATRVDAKSGLYLDNMRQSVQREGEIYLSMAGDCYFEPGRTVETMSEDGDDGVATLQEPFTDQSGVFRIKNDFTRGNYKVIADVSEATATRRDKTVRSSLATAEVAIRANDMELAQAAILTAIMNQDGEGMDDLKRMARQKGVSIGLVKPNEEEQAQMEEAAMQPDPAAVLAEKQGNALDAQAAKDMAQASESESKIKLNEAKALETLADARQRREEALNPPPTPDPAPARPRFRFSLPEMFKRSG